MTGHIKVKFSLAESKDLNEILRLLSDDGIGISKEIFSSNSIDPAYISAFQEIEADPNNEILIGKIEDTLVAVLQVTYIPNLTLRGSKRAQIEGVRVASEMRGKGLGHELFAFALQRAKSKGCRLMQLTTNTLRKDAIRFYESLGFTASHVGLKKEIE